MSYARNLLSRGEEIVYESRQHWFAVIARTWVWILVAIVALALVIFLSGAQDAIGGGDRRRDPDHRCDRGARRVRLAYIGFVMWDWRNQEWLITTRRVMRAEGVLNKSVTDSSLEKINDARLDQSFFGRIFGFGTLDILTAAEESGGEEPRRLPDDRRPGRVQEGDVRPEADAREARTSRRRRATSGARSAGHAASRTDAAARRIRPRGGPRGRAPGPPKRRRRRSQGARRPAATPARAPTTSARRSSASPDCATRA